MVYKNGSDFPVRLIIVVMFVLTATTMGYEGTVLTLKRMISPSHELDLTQLSAFDSARLGRLL